MRCAFFFFIGRINQLVISSLREFADMSIAICNAIASSCLRIIDPDRMDHIESTIDQIDEITELQVLMNIHNVRDEAIKIGAWNEDHEGKLNFFGNMLYNEHDWDVEEVHRYLHEIIASGPQLQDE